MRRSGRSGFTLLEVMVSLAILGLALAAIAGINANSFEESNYARAITVATLLARSKMVDVEETLRKDGFGDSDKEMNGDFSEEGFPSYKWVASCRKVEVNVGQLVEGMFGGEVNADSLPDQMQQFLGAMKGEGAPDLVDKASSSELTKMLGGGGMELIYKQVGETLANSIREVTLEITWGTKKEQESVKFVQYITTTGRLAVPNMANTGSVGNEAIDPLTGLPYPPGQAPGDRNPNTLQTGLGNLGGLVGGGVGGGITNPSGFKQPPANSQGKGGAIGNEGQNKPQPGAGCTTNRDCGSGMVCIAGRCGVQGGPR